MNKSFGSILGLFFAFLLIFALYYITSPQYVVSSYWHYLSTGQYKKAEKLTINPIFNLKFSIYTPLEEAFFQRTKLEHKETHIYGNKATITGKMSLPDIAQALDSNQELAVALQRVPPVQRKYTFELQKTKEGWKINSLTFGGE